MHIRTAGRQLFSTIALFATAAILSACGGGGGGGAAGASAGGQANKGIIQSGLVRAKEVGPTMTAALDAAGYPIPTVVRGLGSDYTDMNGLYSLSLAGHGGAVVQISVEADATEGTKMVCDTLSGCGAYAFGEPVPVTVGFELTALVGTMPAGATAVDVQVTPFTHAAALAARTKAAAFDPPGLTLELVDATNAAVGQMIGGIDILTTPVVDITDVDALSTIPAAQQTYAYLNAAIMQIAATEYGGDVEAAIGVLAATIADGIGNAIDGGSLTVIGIDQLFAAAAAEATAGGNPDAAAAVTALDPSAAGDVTFFLDTDADTVEDYLDNCPSTPNLAQTDTDGDGVGDACDAAPADPSLSVDADGDLVDDRIDNCLGLSNASQADGDGDGIGDLCDRCAGDADNDIDHDGICAGTGFASPMTADADNCPTVSNASQADTGGTVGVGDACDTSAGAGTVTTFTTALLSGKTWEGRGGNPLDTTYMNFGFQSNGTFAWAEIDNATGNVISKYGRGTWTLSAAGVITINTIVNGFPMTGTFQVQAGSVSTPTQIYVTMNDGTGPQAGIFTPSLNDADADAIPTLRVGGAALDNCPTVANTNQVDIDPGTPAGTACETPLGTPVSALDTVLLNNTTWKLNPQFSGPEATHLVFRTGGGFAHATSLAPFLESFDRGTWAVQADGSVLVNTVSEFNRVPGGVPTPVILRLVGTSSGSDKLYVSVKVGSGAIEYASLTRPLPGDPDPDLDGLVTSMDNCPTVSNNDQADEDGDGIGDACMFTAPMAAEAAGPVMAAGVGINEYESWNTAPGSINPMAESWGYGSIAMAPGVRTMDFRTWDYRIPGWGAPMAGADRPIDLILNGAGTSWQRVLEMPVFLSANTDGTVTAAHTTNGAASGAVGNLILATHTASVAGQNIAALFVGSPGASAIDPSATFSAGAKAVQLRIRPVANQYRLWFDDRNCDPTDPVVAPGGNCNTVGTASGYAATLANVIQTTPSASLAAAPAPVGMDRTKAGGNIMVELVNNGTNKWVQFWHQNGMSTVGMGTGDLLVQTVGSQTIYAFNYPPDVAALLDPRDSESTWRILAEQGGAVRKGSITPANRTDTMLMMNNVARDEYAAAFNGALVASVNNTDTDRDEWVDAEDNCIYTPNWDQLDTTPANGIGDACEASDMDGDTVIDQVDNCPFVSNVSQLDSDSDGYGDACQVGVGATVTTFNDVTVPGLWRYTNPTSTDDLYLLFRADNTFAWVSTNTAGTMVNGTNDGTDWTLSAGGAITVNTVDGGTGLPISVTVTVRPESHADRVYVTLNVGGTPENGVLFPVDPTLDTDSDGVINTADNCPLVANTDQLDTDHNGVGDACMFAAPFAATDSATHFTAQGIGQPDGENRMSADGVNTIDDWFYWTATLDGTPALVQTVGFWDRTSAGFITATTTAGPGDLILDQVADTWTRVRDFPVYIQDNGDGTISIGDSTDGTVGGVIASMTILTETTSINGENMASLFAGSPWGSGINPASTFGAGADAVRLTITQTSDTYDLWHYSDCPVVPADGNCNVVKLSGGSDATTLASLVNTASFNPNTTVGELIGTDGGWGVSIMVALVDDMVSKTAYYYAWNGATYTGIGSGQWEQVTVGTQTIYRFRYPYQVKALIPQGSGGDSDWRIVAVEGGVVRVGEFAPTGNVTRELFLNGTAMSQVTAAFTAPATAANTDTDGDGWVNSTDRCHTVWDDTNADSDGDGLGDACDGAPADGLAGGDVDADGIDGLLDNCPAVANAGQADADGDGKGDACDIAPADGVLY